MATRFLIAGSRLATATAAAGRSVLDRFYVHFAATVADDSINDGVQGVVPASLDTVSGKKRRPTLPNQNSAARDQLPAETFHTAKLRAAVSTVTG